MKNKIISLILIFSMVISMSTISNANIQIPVEKVKIDEVYYVEGEHAITGETIITPTIDVSWENPNKWSSNPPGSTEHNPYFYEVEVENLTLNKSETIVVNKDTDEYDKSALEIHEKVSLDTGSLYKIQVQPYHYHTDSEGNLELAPNVGSPEYAYVITDLDVDFVTSEDSIQVIWDDIGDLDSEDFRYRIVYAVGDYSTQSKQELINNREGELTDLTANSEGVTRFYDSKEKRYKLSYTIDENIYPGQVYSIMVEPITDYYNGEAIARNRNLPMIRTCSTNVKLYLYEDGDYLRFEWDVPDSFKVGQDSDRYELVEATLIQYKDGQASNIAIFDNDSGIIGYYTIPKPSKETQYQIKFVYRAVEDGQTKAPIEPVSNIVTYVPEELEITPTKPYIPKLISESTLRELLDNYSTDQVRDILKNEYLVPGYSYTEDLDDLLTKNITYHVDTDNNIINFVWGAFPRIDVDEESSTYGKYIYDNNVYYDIWVTDSLESLSYGVKIISDKRVTDITDDDAITDGQEIFGYKESLTSYYNDKLGEVIDIAPDKLYYIKIVAKKKTANGELISEPSITSVYYSYSGDVFAPPTISKPPLKIKEEETTEDGVTITWKEEWWEVISLDAAAGEVLSSWTTEVWIGEDGTIYDKEVPEAEYYAVYSSESEAIRLRDDLSSSGVNIQYRKVDLGLDPYGISNVKYKFARIPYEEVQEAIELKKDIDPDYTFADYYYDLIKDDKNGTNKLEWKDIDAEVDPDDSSRLLYREEGLQENTSYLFMLYPYREAFTGELLYSHYPSPIIVATNPAEIDVTPDPTVPYLYISGSTDISIDVSWKYNKDFEYELVYSLHEDIDTATLVEWSIPEDIDDPLYPVDGEYYEVKVNNLFPETQYYFWIRAIQPSTNTVSAWSNVAIGKTKEVSTPNPPKGVGVASKESMKLYNYDESITEDYIAIEWILDEADKEPEETQVVTKTYSYIMEVSENSKFVDPIYIHSTGGSSDEAPSNVEILEKNLIKVNDLISNREYYIRVKTRVTVTGSEEGQIIIKDSIYSGTIKVRTSSSKDEYDGEYDPDLEILPDENYEIIYDKKERSLEFRFRDDEVDEDGFKDNNVDQRLISELIEDNVYTYEIDIASYGKNKIEKRKVTIPYSVIEAFNEYKVSLFIDADELRLEIPFKAIYSEIERQVNQYGVYPKVEISIEDLDSGYLKKGYPDNLITSTINEKLIEITVSSKRVTKTLEYTDKKMTVELETKDKRAVIYAQNYKKQWERLSSSYNNRSGFSTFETANLGAYVAGILSTQNSNITTDKYHWSQMYRQAVFSRYHIEGLEPYNPENYVTESDLINIIYNIINKNENINLDTRINSNMIRTLQQAEIKLSDSYTRSSVSREEAISMFVRTYEIMNDEIIEPSNYIWKQIQQSSNISSIYKENIAKAVTIGLISDINNLRPKDPIKYGELFALWAK